MDNLSHGRVVGIDVSRDWLDLHCLPDGLQCRLPNGPKGHAAVADLARDRDAVVCFESTGGQEWQLWETLETEGLMARQVPPARGRRHSQEAVARAQRPTELTRSSLPASLYFDPMPDAASPQKN